MIKNYNFIYRTPKRCSTLHIDACCQGIVIQHEKLAFINIRNTKQVGQPSPLPRKREDRDRAERSCSEDKRIVKGEDEAGGGKVIPAKFRRRCP